MKLTKDNHRHSYFVTGLPDEPTYCIVCGLLKSTIEQNEFDDNLTIQTGLGNWPLDFVIINGVKYVREK